LFITFCFQSSWNVATNYCQMEQQIQRDARGFVHTARVTQQCQHTYCRQDIENGDGHLTLQIWIPWRYCVWEWCKKLFEIFIRTQNSFWIESHIGEDMGQFSTVQLTKLPQVLGRGSESTRRLMKNILSI